MAKNWVGNTWARVLPPSRQVRFNPIQLVVLTSLVGGNLIMIPMPRYLILRVIIIMELFSNSSHALVSTRHKTDTPFGTGKSVDLNGNHYVVVSTPGEDTFDGGNQFTIASWIEITGWWMGNHGSQNEEKVVRDGRFVDGAESKE